MRRMSGGGAGGNVFNVGKSKAQLFDKGANTMSVTFKDIAGLAEANKKYKKLLTF